MKAKISVFVTSVEVIKYLLLYYLYDLTFNQNIAFCRSSRPEVFCKKGVLKQFVQFTEKHLC